MGQILYGDVGCYLAAGPEIGFCAFSLQFCDFYIYFVIDAKISHGKYKGLSVTSSKSITVIENEDVLAFIFTFTLH